MEIKDKHVSITCSNCYLWIFSPLFHCMLSDRSILPFLIFLFLTYNAKHKTKQINMSPFKQILILIIVFKFSITRCCVGIWVCILCLPDLLLALASLQERKPAEQYKNSQLPSHSGCIICICICIFFFIC